MIGPGDAIHRPRVSTLLDYEAELGIVIGRRCRHVPLERAHEVIGGYVVVNDVTCANRPYSWTCSQQDVPSHQNQLLLL